MKTMNTSTIFDNSKSLVNELYQARLGDMDIAVPEVQRAILELKLYHLPPIYDVPQKIRNRVALRSEVDLFKESEIAVYNKSQCSSCFTRKPLYGMHTTMCLECWTLHLQTLWRDFPIRINNWAQILNCSSYIPANYLFITKEPWAKNVEASTIKELIAGARNQLRFFPVSTRQSVECWTTPKKAFLIQELGCIKCGARPDFREVGWLWSADFSDWSNGYCPMCIDIDPCHQGVWGMSDQEYRAWQDSYTESRLMQRTIARYGALSLLLVSTSAHWANYVTKVVPHNHGRPIGSIIANKPIHDMMHSKAKSISDLGLSINDLLNTKHKGE